MDFEEAKTIIDKVIGFVQWSTNIDSDIRTEIMKELWNVRLFIKRIDKEARSDG